MRLNPLIILFISLVLTESIVMLLLSLIADTHINHSLLVILDASVVSLVAIGVINQLFKNGSLVLHRNARLKFLAFDIGVIVFTVEALIMLFLEFIPFNLNDWQLGLVDVCALSLLSAVLIHFFIFKNIMGDKRSYTNELIGIEPIIISSILAYVCFAIILLVGLLSSYQNQLTLKRQDLERLEIIELEQAKVAFLDRLNNTSHDLLIYSRDHDVPQSLSDNVVPQFLSSISHAKENLQSQYRNILAIKDYYVQIRVLNTKGREVIRVQRNGSEIEVIPQQKLQNKSERYYFKKSINLQRGQFYISAFDLNIEQGKIELPFNPMIRLATPVVDKKGKTIGVMVINLRGNYLLSKLKNITEESSGKVMLLDSKGYWLFGGDTKANWAFMFDDKLTLNFQNKHPEIWEKIIHMKSDIIQSELTSVILKHIEFTPEQITEQLTAKANVQYSERHWPIWRLVSFISSKQITEKLRDTRKSLTILYFSILLVGACATILLAHTMISRRKYQTEVQKQAFYDHLTGLCNSRLFTKKMEQEFARSRRDSTGLALMYFDLDYFKLINDEFGHKAGDEALKEAAIRFESCLRECDIVARIGGDEFAALLPKPGNLQDIMGLAERIIESFKEPFEVLGHRRNLGISIGIAISRGDNENNSSIMHRADHAMYEAKRDGRNCFKFS